jgi:hypothetical protein
MAVSTLGVATCAFVKPLRASRNSVILRSVLCDEGSLFAGRGKGCAGIPIEIPGRANAGVNGHQILRFAQDDKSYNL